MNQFYPNKKDFTKYWDKRRSSAEIKSDLPVASALQCTSSPCFSWRSSDYKNQIVCFKEIPN